MSHFRNAHGALFDVDEGEDAFDFAAAGGAPEDAQEWTLTYEAIQRVLDEAEGTGPGGVAIPVDEAPRDASGADLPSMEEVEVVYCSIEWQH